MATLSRGQRHLALPVFGEKKDRKIEAMASFVDGNSRTEGRFSLQGIPPGREGSSAAGGRLAMFWSIQSWQARQVRNSCCLCQCPSDTSPEQQLGNLFLQGAWEEAFLCFSPCETWAAPIPPWLIPKALVDANQGQQPRVAKKLPQEKSSDDWG